jgi:hypothetical protein
MKEVKNKEKNLSDSEKKKLIESDKKHSIPLRNKGFDEHNQVMSLRLIEYHRGNKEKNK